MRKQFVLVVLLFGLCLLLGTGCTSYVEFEVVDYPTVALDHGVKPLTVFEAANVSYQFFGVIPFTTGVQWSEGPFSEFSDTKIHFFSDEATIDNNLTALKCALKEVGSDRIMNLVTTIQDNSMWSLFVINRHIVKTTCVILEPEKASPPSVAPETGGTPVVQ